MTLLGSSTLAISASSFAGTPGEGAAGAGAAATTAGSGAAGLASTAAIAGLAAGANTAAAVTLLLPIARPGLARPKGDSLGTIGTRGLPPTVTLEPSGRKPAAVALEPSGRKPAAVAFEPSGRKPAAVVFDPNWRMPARVWFEPSVVRLELSVVRLEPPAAKPLTSPIIGGAALATVSEAALEAPSKSSEVSTSSYATSSTGGRQPPKVVAATVPNSAAPKSIDHAEISCFIRLLNGRSFGVQL